MERELSLRTPCSAARSDERIDIVSYRGVKDCQSRFHDMLSYRVRGEERRAVAGGLSHVCADHQIQLTDVSN